MKEKVKGPGRPFVLPERRRVRFQTTVSPETNRRIEELREEGASIPEMLDDFFAKQ